jgi:hypothetical protein
MKKKNKTFIVEFGHWEKYVIFTDDGRIVSVIENSSLEKEVDIAKVVCEAIKEHECMSTCDLLENYEFVYDDSGREIECELTHDEDEQHDIRTYKIYQTTAYRA